MTKQHRLALFVCAAIILPIVGYVITYAMAYIFPMWGQIPWLQSIIVVVITIGLLVVPYWMLKLMAHVSHEVNPEEKELRLKDIPKDKEQLDHSPK